MKRNRFIILFLLCASLFSCSKNEISGDDDTQSEEMIRALSDVNEVSEQMSDVFLSAESAGEMAEHLDEINALEQVERAWAESDAVYATLKNGLTMFWFFPPVEDESAAGIHTTRMAVLDSIFTARATRGPDGGNPNIASDLKICIINQMSNDENLNYVTEYLSKAAQTFRHYGYEVREVNGEEFTPTFIRKEMTNYNIVVLCTHGSSPKNPTSKGKHWIYTGLDMKKLEDIWSGDDVMIGNIKEKRGFLNLSKNIRYLRLSEDWFEKKENMGQFSDQSMVFSFACHSLEGNDNLWKAFKTHNLGCYFGYNEEVGCEWSTKTSFDMLASLMVLGGTAKGAYSLLDTNYKEYDYKAKVTDIIEDNGKKVEKKGSRDVHVELKFCCRTDDYDMSMCDAVDLGLSVKWGTRNLGAKTPFELGDFDKTNKEWQFYQWGNIASISEYEKRNYDFSIKEGWENTDYDISGNPKYDPATAILGEPWRMPTLYEVMELASLCTAINVENGQMYGEDDWVSRSSSGVLLVSNVKYAEGVSSGIFLPYYWNSAGHYLTGQLTPDTEVPSYEFTFGYTPYRFNYILNVSAPGKTGTKGKIGYTYSSRAWKSSIRPVYGEKKL